MRAYASRITVLVVGFVMLASTLLVIGNSGAQENQGGSGLGISPTRTELNIEPGKTDEVEISVRNVTNGAIVAKPFVSDFESDDATGEPRLYADTEKRNSASINSFISGLQDIELDPGESKTLKYTVTIPGNAAPGAYYGAITYRAVPASQAATSGNGEVTLTANVASLVLIEVAGDITEQIQLDAIEIGKRTQDNKLEKIGTFFTSKPTGASITIRNNGNGFSKPFGKVAITDMSGKEVAGYELNDATPRSNVLPKTKRAFVNELKDINRPGKYTLTASISHGNGGEVITKAVSFWYIPAWLLIALGVLILGLIAAGFFLYRKYFGGRKKRR